MKMKKESKILIIEDDKKMQDIIKSQVNKLTNNITLTKTGPEAIKHIEDDHPDIIILDLYLKDINGFELTRLIKRNYKVPIITLTSSDQVAPCIRAHQEGADACLAIPLKQKELKTTIEKLI